MFYVGVEMLAAMFLIIICISNVDTARGRIRDPRTTAIKKTEGQGLQRECVQGWLDREREDQ